MYTKYLLFVYIHNFFFGAVNAGDLFISYFAFHQHTFHLAFSILAKLAKQKFFFLVYTILFLSHTFPLFVYSWRSWVLFSTIVDVVVVVLLLLPLLLLLASFPFISPFSGFDLVSFFLSVCVRPTKRIHLHAYHFY